MYRIYRAIKVSNFQEINLEKMGISWAADELSAIKFGEDFQTEFLIVSAVVTANQINIAQTNAQWNSKQHSSEGEVVLNDLQDIVVEFEGETYNGRIDDENSANDETRPDAEPCDELEITSYLEKA